MQFMNETQQKLKENPNITAAPLFNFWELGKRPSHWKMENKTIPIEDFEIKFNKAKEKIAGES